MTSLSTIRIPCSVDYNQTGGQNGYFLLLDIFSIVNFIISPYAMFCIIFRSTKYMKTYRWYLLYHQVIGFASDITLSFLLKPIIIIPFPAGKIFGPAKNFVPREYCLSWAVSLITLNMATVAHLFGYRLSTVQGKRRVSNLVIAWFIFIIIIALLPPCLGVALASKDINEVFADLKEVPSFFSATMRFQTYDCITDDLIDSPDALAYDRNALAHYAIFPLLLDVFIFVGAVVYYIIAAYKAIQHDVASENLRKMQRLFLLQLSIQAFLPMLIVVLPGVPLVIFVAFEVYGFQWLADLTICSVSLFSLIGAAVLIIMNPTYHSWVHGTWFKKKQKKERSTIVIINPSIR